MKKIEKKSINDYRVELINSKKIYIIQGIEFRRRLLEEKVVVEKIG